MKVQLPQMDPMGSYHQNIKHRWRHPPTIPAASKLKTRTLASELIAKNSDLSLTASFKVKSTQNLTCHLMTPPPKHLPTQPLATQLTKTSAS